MSNYILITPEIEDDAMSGRAVGKTFIASAVVEKLRADHKVVLHIDESKFDTDITTRQVNDEILRGAAIRNRKYDYIVIAGLRRDVENTFRTLRKSFYPENIKTIKLQSLS